MCQFLQVQGLQESDLDDEERESFGRVSHYVAHIRTPHSAVQDKVE